MGGYNSSNYGDEFDIRSKVPGGGFSGGMDFSQGVQPAPSTPAPQAPQMPSDPAQFVKDTGRWSLHLANRPDWVNSSNEGEALSHFNNKNEDPNAWVQGYLQSQRAAGKTDEGDAMALSGLGYSGGRKPTATGTMQAPQFSNTNPMFDDPASRLIEDYALNRFQQKQNPDPNSGTAMFEKMARDLVTKLQGPVYSASDEAIIKTKVTDNLMQEQDQALAQWQTELSRRGLSPSSGPALEGILKIKEHFQQARTAVDAEFARNAIQQTRDQRFQALDTAGKLAGSEENRLTEALTYASLPKQLSDNAFQQGLQLVGAGGNPSSMLNSALSIYNSTLNGNRYDSNQRAQTIESIMQWISQNY